jgi:hypothetical protein
VKHYQEVTFSFSPVAASPVTDEIVRHAFIDYHQNLEVVLILSKIKIKEPFFLLYCVYAGDYEYVSLRQTTKPS